MRRFVHPHQGDGQLVDKEGLLRAPLHSVGAADTRGLAIRPAPVVAACLPPHCTVCRPGSARTRPWSSTPRTPTFPPVSKHASFSKMNRRIANRFGIKFRMSLVRVGSNRVKEFHRCIFRKVGIFAGTALQTPFRAPAGVALVLDNHHELDVRIRTPAGMNATTKDF